jgi:hypothetical protein
VGLLTDENGDMIVGSRMAKVNGSRKKFSQRSAAMERAVAANPKHYVHASPRGAAPSLAAPRRQGI